MCATGIIIDHREATGALIGQLLNSDLTHDSSLQLANHSSRCCSVGLT